MTLLLGSLLLFAAGGLLALLTSGRPWLASIMGCAGTVAGALLGILAAVTALTAGGSPF